jgi:long-subunit fatty acid transport protein
VRWTDWDDFALTPPVLGSNLANIVAEFRYTLGVARRFNENFVGLANLTYEKDDGRPGGSPLGPFEGLLGLSLGGRYTTGNLNISGGVSYTMLGDANAAIGPTNIAAFTNNDVIGVGLRFDYSF